MLILFLYIVTSNCIDFFHSLLYVPLVYASKTGCNSQLCVSFTRKWILSLGQHKKIVYSTGCWISCLNKWLHTLFTFNYSSTQLFLVQLKETFKTFTTSPYHRELCIYERYNWLFFRKQSKCFAYKYILWVENAFEELNSIFFSSSLWKFI